MNTTVLIVGAGPVGLTLACEFTRYRVPLRIVDKAPQRTDKSKAIVIWSRTLELLDRGDQGSARFVEAGFKVDGVNIVAADGAVVGHVKMDSVASPYPYALMLPQSDTERLLEERLQRLGVSVERSTEATALAIGAEGVEATLRRADGGKETVHADGAGDEPCFTLLASSSPAVAGVLSSFPKLLNDALGTPPAPNGVWLIRPDGYVAATTPANNLSSISDVLGRISA
jgi:2-polyprenyl-6-methoxyphenol hydroxylase-like FAD-dependent oxidoreductase